MSCKKGVLKIKILQNSLKNNKIYKINKISGSSSATLLEGDSGICAFVERRQTTTTKISSKNQINFV